VKSEWLQIYHVVIYLQPFTARTIFMPPVPTQPLSKAQYEALSEFRYQLRRFIHFSESAAKAAGLTPLQYLLMLHVQGATPYRTTLGDAEDATLSYLPTHLAGLPQQVTILDADRFYLTSAGSAKYCQASDLASYMLAEAWGATPGVAVQTGDALLVSRSGGVGTLKVTVDMLADFVTSDAQAAILDLSSLAAATVTTTDLVLVCQSGAAKRATVADVQSLVHGGFATYTTGLTAVVSVADADVIYLVRGSTPQRATAAQLANYVTASVQGLPWRTIDSGKYTAIPASTSQITMSDTSDVRVGLPVAYTYNGARYYGIVTAVSANASMTIAGAPLDVAHAITELQVGLASQVVQHELYIPGDYDAGVQDLLAVLAKRYFRWQFGAAHLVAFSAVHKTADTGAQPKINVKVNGTLVSTNDAAKGIQMGAAGVWVDNPAVAVSTTNYTVVRGNPIEVRLTQVGTNGNANDLTVSLTFVLE